MREATLAVAVPDEDVVEDGAVAAADKRGLDESLHRVVRVG